MVDIVMVHDLLSLYCIQVEVNKKEKGEKVVVEGGRCDVM